MSIVGILVGVGLWILGVPLALALGVWSGLIAFIPNIGPILSTGATAIVALEAGGPWLLLYSVLPHIGVQIVESYLITPLIQKMAIAMPPALTLSAQAVMGNVVWRRRTRSRHATRRLDDPALAPALYRRLSRRRVS
jgi:predicted PurR-regulated permease PerM